MPTRSLCSRLQSHTEYVLGEVHGSTQPDLDKARQEVAWAAVYSVSERTSDLVTEIAAAINDQGPQLTAIDALVAGTGQELSAPVVAGDSDLTHPATKKIVDVEEHDD